MPSRSLLLLLVAVGACRSGTTTPVDATLTFEPATVTFGDVFEGHRRVENVSLVLASVAGCSDVTLEATGAFTVDEAGTLTLDAAEKKTLHVRPPAAGLGLHTGTLTASGCGLEATAELSATLIAAPTCTSTSQCRTARFDVDTGLCTDDAVTDGTPCSDTCLDGASCRAGECRGQAKSCSDGDPCTLDFCSRETGCMSLPATNVCPPLAECSSACQGPTCPPGNAQLLWSLQTEDALGAPQAALAGDAAGNLYWLEHSEAPHTVSLVSATPAGAIRYRRTFMHIAGNSSLTPMVVGDVVLLSPDGFGSRAYAFRASDGVLLWDQYLREVFSPTLQTTTWCDHGAALDDRTVAFAMTFSAGSSPPAAVLAIDVATGQKRWARSEPDILWGLAVDEDQNVYLDVKSSSVRSLDAHGMARFVTHVRSLSVISAGRVYGSTAAVTTTTGEAAFSFPSSYFLNASPDLALRTTDAKRGELLSPVDGTPRGAFDVGPELIQDVMLTSGGGALVVSSESSRAPHVRGVNAQGEQQFVCTLANMGPPVTAGVLHDGRYYVFEQPEFGAKGTLRAWLLNGQALAPHGWVARDATVQRTRRPLR
ncbi:MAG: PQQ-like beta-propeller repeat protein [Myxococcaceae bacterium]|nr:PQQ-like beta-propeller repeat protein [Myxococcaceae bacterium]